MSEQQGSGPDWITAETLAETLARLKKSRGAQALKNLARATDISMVRLDELLEGEPSTPYEVEAIRAYFGRGPMPKKP